MGRREKAGVLEYEVKWWDRPEKHNLYIDKDRLERTGHAEAVLGTPRTRLGRACGPRRRTLDLEWSTPGHVEVPALQHAPASLRRTPTCLPKRSG